MTTVTLPWLESSIIEPQPLLYPRHLFATTKRLNRVSKSSVLCGSDNIGVRGRSIIESGAVLRGDLSTIELGSYCVIGERAVLRPPEQRFQGRVAHIPMTVGDHVVVEEGSVVEAAAIGDCTHIGKNCHIVRQTTQQICRARKQSLNPVSRVGADQTFRFLFPPLSSPS